MIQQTLKPQNTLIVDILIDAVVQAKGTQLRIEISGVAMSWILAAAAKGDQRV